MKLSRILVFLFLVGIAIILSIFLCLFFAFFSSSHDERETKTSTSYFYQEIMLSSDTISNGFVEMKRRFSDDEFLTYPSSNGKQVIVSNFASSQFKCEGSCTCSNNQRRYSTPIISRPFFLIISAISTSLAFTIAEKSFHDQCLLHFSSECEEENIDSSVTSCSEKEEKATLESNEEEKEENDYAEFDCEGYCIKQKFMWTTAHTLSVQRNFIADTGECETLKTTGTFVYERKITEKGRKKWTRKAQRRFLNDFLSPFCKEMSKREFWYVNPTSKRRHRRKAFMCVGGGN